MKITQSYQEAYDEGYEQGLKFGRMMPQHKSWFTVEEYPYYQLGHKHAVLNLAECYGDGRQSVINMEDIRQEDYFADQELFYFYLIGRRDELND